MVYIPSSFGIRTILACHTLVRGRCFIKQKYFTYIVRCKNGILYTGYTNDLAKRIAQHNENKGAKFTRGRGPVTLVYFEEFSTRGEAMAREIQIKRLTKPEKEKLISGDDNG